ncbi:MAG: hypothetical protein M3R70_00385 [Actinomycetota bacterium]|nr:hypothetical protein [Actinomycetota bacterium]
MLARLIRLGAIVPALFLLSPGLLIAVGAGNGRMVAEPTRVVAGSTGNTLTFTFTAVPRAQVGDLIIDTPVQWSRWQLRDASGRGFVQFDRGTCAAGTRIASIRGRRMLIKTKCRRGAGFSFTYANATAAKLLADGYVFLTQTRPLQKRGQPKPRYKPLPEKRQPVVRTLGGPAVELTVSAPGVVTSGVQFTITVRVNDKFGNPAAGYSKTVTFSSSDPQGTVPPPYTFGAEGASKDLGGVILKTPGEQRIRASDGQGLTAVSGPIVVTSPARP